MKYPKPKDAVNLGNLEVDTRDYNMRLQVLVMMMVACVLLYVWWNMI